MTQRIIRIYAEAFRGLPPSIWWLSFVALVHRSGTMVLPFLSLYATEALGMGVDGAGLVLASFGVGSIVGSFLGGWLSDRFGAMNAQLMTMLSSGFFMMGMALLKDPTSFLIGIFFTSIIGEAFRPAMLAIVSQYSPEELQGRSFGLLRLAVNLGMALGPAVGGILADIEFAWLFIGNGLICFVSSATLLWARPRIGEVPPPQEESNPHGAHQTPWKDVPFLVLVGLVGVYGCLLFQVFSTLPVYLRDGYGYTKTAIGLILAVNALLIVVFEMILLRRLEDRPPMSIVAWGCGLTAIGFGILPLEQSLLVAMASVVLWTFGEMLVLPFSNVIAAQCAKPSTRGQYMGLYASTFSFSFVVAPFAGTRIYDRFGADVLWFSVAAVGVLLTLACRCAMPTFASNEKWGREVS